MNIQEISFFIIIGIVAIIFIDMIFCKKHLNNFNQQRDFLKWLSNEDYFNIPKDEINEIMEDWKTYKSN